MPATASASLFSLSSVQMSPFIILFCSQSRFNGPSWDLPGGPVVRTSASTAEGMGLLPGWGTRISHVVWYSQKRKMLKKKSLLNSSSSQRSVFQLLSFSYVSLGWRTGI